MSLKSLGSYETIIAEGDDDGICYITLNRPEILNAATDQMVIELNDAFFEFDANDDLRVAILKGNGRAFCSGADVRQRQLRPPEAMKRFGGPQGRDEYGRWAKNEFFANSVNWKPIIAAVHGYAIGLGLGLTFDSDLVVAAEGTMFQNRETQRGIGGGHIWATAKFWGGDRFANDISLTGRMFSAEEALAHGLVNRVVPNDQLLETARGLALEIAQHPPLSVQATVRIGRWFTHRLHEEVRYFTDARALHLSHDFRESAQAYMEKRKPNFLGK